VAHPEPRSTKESLVLNLREGRKPLSPGFQPGSFASKFDATLRFFVDFLAPRETQAHRELPRSDSLSAPTARDGSERGEEGMKPAPNRREIGARDRLRQGFAITRNEIEMALAEADSELARGRRRCHELEEQIGVATAILLVAEMNTDAWSGADAAGEPKLEFRGDGGDDTGRVAEPATRLKTAM
jgi:hypothetical protein